MADLVVLHLGPPPAGAPPVAHALACQDLLDVDPTGRPAAGVAGAWWRLVDRTRAAHGTVELWCEPLRDAPADVVSRVLADLAPAQVRVVPTPLAAGPADRNAAQGDHQAR